jgi:hypothetical protein
VLGIADQELIDAIHRADRGLVDADLGGGVIKQRIARPGEGKSGGFRSIVLFRKEELAFFVFGFAKNAQDNIDRKELKAFRALTDDMLAYDNETLAKAIRSGALTEVKDDDKQD